MNQMLNNRYLVISAVGQGGMGAVYKALDTQLGNRVVAIKEMSQRQMTAQQISTAARAFKQEADLLAGLRHPNLPSIHEHFEMAGGWYLVMEFIEGETLDAYLQAQGGRLPINEVLDIALQLSTVLEYLHSRQPPIIFRDLKPLNIMRESGGHLYLIDFGIARHFKLGQAKDTNISGTPGYAPPEQYGRAQSTPRTDIYSLGVLLHTLLSGLDPAPFHLSPLHLQGHPQAANLEALILTMTELDEQKRPATMRVVQQELQRMAAPGSMRAPNVQQPSFIQPTVVHPQPPTASVQAPPQVQILSASAPTQPAFVGNINTPGLPARRGVSRRTVFLGLAGVVAAGAAGGLWWELQSAAAPTFPGFAVHSVWAGLANQYNNTSHYSMILKLDAIDGVTFSGTITYPDLGNSVTAMAGTIVNQLGDATEQSKWQAVPRFNSREQGSKLKFTENSVVKASPGYNIILGVQYYAFASTDGSIRGIWFDSVTSTDPRGDYELYKTQ